MEGSVRKAGNRLRVNAQLINAEDGYHLWSERYDRDMDDVFAVQDEIASAVVEKLKVKLLDAADGPLIRKPTDNVETYNLVLKGRYYQQRATPEALQKSLECSNQALAIEPAYAQAHAGVAISETQRSVASIAPPRQLMPTAKKAAVKALTSDDTVDDAHFALGMVLHWFEWDWPGAEREYRCALDLNPGDTFTRSVRAVLLGQIGQADESIAEARAAVERDPLSVFNHHMVIMTLHLARRLDQAIAEARAGLDLDPTYHLFHRDLGLPMVCLGRYEEGIEALRKGATLSPDDLFPRAYLAGC